MKGGQFKGGAVLALGRLGAELGSRISGGMRSGMLLGFVLGAFGGAMVEMVNDAIEDEVAQGVAALDVWEDEGGAMAPSLKGDEECETAA